LKSLGEKKQCFNEYIATRKAEEKEAEKQRVKQVGDEGEMTREGKGAGGAWRFVREGVAVCSGERSY
jgi:hypothetical protein